MARSPEEHLDAVRDVVGERPTMHVAVEDAVTGLFRLADDVTASADAPAFDNSQMDGYAVPSAAGGTFIVGTTVPAGVDPDVLYPDGLNGSAAPVMTGAKIPRGTRAVIPVEACTPSKFVEEGATVRMPKTNEGTFIRRTGDDVRRGSLIAPFGTTISPVLAGALSSQGIERVRVHSPAWILLVTGGAEVGGAGAAQIRDANTPMLKAMAHRYGIEVAATVSTDDDPSRLSARIAQVVDETLPNAIVTSGGISHGKFEVVRQVLNDGWYGHVTQQPGGPQGLSRYRGIPVISLPGNPISSLVSFRLYVAPVLGVAPDPLWMPSAEPVTGLADKDQFLRGRIEEGYAAPVGGAGSHLLAQSATATCLLRVPANTNLSKGELIRVYPL